jgi:TolB-like protein
MEQELASSLARALGGAAQAVSGAELERALAGTSLGTEGRIDAASAAKVGAAVGATHVVAGTFMDHFGKVRLDARVIDVRTGRVVKTASAGPGDRAEMTAMVNQLAAQVRAAAGG